MGLQSRFTFHANLVRMSVFTVALTSPVVHADALRVGLGYGQGVELYAFGIQLDRKSPVHEYEAWTLTGHVDLGIGEFRAHHSDSSHGTTRALAAIAKLRWQRREARRVQPFIEVGLGISGFSETNIAGTRHLGGGFEFTEVVRGGLRFGARRQWEVALYGQHFSNAGLHRPNEGITYAGVSTAWYFR